MRGLMTAAYQRMTDMQLANEERKALAKLAQIRPAISPIGQRLLAQYQDKLDQVRIEIERRACD